MHVDSGLAEPWSDEQVAECWITLYKAPSLVGRWFLIDLKSEAEMEKVVEIIAMWRERLTDISWFMCKLNEYVARETNKEEGV